MGSTDDPRVLVQIITRIIDEKDAQIIALSKQVEDKNETIGSLNQQFQEQATEIDDLKKDNESFKEQIDYYKEQLKEATRDQREFTKVSQVVQLEKDNAKLKADVTMLEERIKRLLNKQQTVIESKHIEQEVAEPEPDIESDLENPPGPQVYEKKIKGVSYYISDDDDMIIYKKEDDGSIGPALGKLERHAETQKLKIIWNQVADEFTHTSGS